MSFLQLRTVFIWKFCNSLLEPQPDNLFVLLLTPVIFFSSLNDVGRTVDSQKDTGRALEHW